MRFYNIYASNDEHANALLSMKKDNLKPNSRVAIPDLICIKHGFNWRYALIYFNAFYAFVGRRYLVAFLMLVLSLSFDLLTRALMMDQNLPVLYFMGYFARLGSFWLFGVLGGTLEESCVRSDGGRWLACIFASNEIDAIQRFYDSIALKGL